MQNLPSTHIQENVPGSDPDFPPYGRGTGASPLADGAAAFETPLADGAAAFETPPIDPIDARTQSDPRFSRRELKASRQELGYAIPSMAEFDPQPAAARPIDTYADTPPSRFGDPKGTHGLTPPDDRETAVNRVTQ